MAQSEYPEGIYVSAAICYECFIVVFLVFGIYLCYRVSLAPSE